MKPDWWVSWVQTFLILAGVTRSDRLLSAFYILSAVAVYIHGHWPRASEPQEPVK